MTEIHLERMAFYAKHGCFEEERVIGTRFVADCKLVYDATEAACQDDISKAIDYQHVYAIIKKEMEQPSALLEHVARRILDALHAQWPQLLQAEVRLCKLQPPLGGNIGRVCVVMRSEDR